MMVCEHATRGARHSDMFEANFSMINEVKSGSTLLGESFIGG